MASLRIGLAEQDDAARGRVAQWLNELGHRVTAVVDGRELVQLCRSRPVDVVVSDVRMPQLDGLTAAVVLRRERGVPAVLMSGSWTVAEREQARAVGAVILCKPFQPLDLTAALARVSTQRVSRWRVLVATDADDGFAARLAAAGYEVADCPVAETSAAAEMVRPHLLLVDATAAGREGVRQVRARAWAGRMRVVAIGGWEPTDQRAERVAGCDGHLTRPVGVDELACLLER